MTIMPLAPNQQRSAFHSPQLRGFLYGFFLTALITVRPAYADTHTFEPFAGPLPVPLSQLPANKPNRASPPRAFDARYSVSLNGLPTGLSALSQLRLTGNHYLFTLKAKSWIMDYQEKSAFTWPDKNQCHNQPEYYRFSFKGFKVSSEFEVGFNYQTFMASSYSEEGTQKFEIPPKVGDALSYLLVLQCDLRNGHFTPEYKIGYENGIESYLFRYVGKERIRTIAGKIETLRLERIYRSKKYKTTYWIAPELDFLMVRMKHKEGKIVTAKLNLKEINYDNLEEILPDDEDLSDEEVPDNTEGYSKDKVINTNKETGLKAHYSQ